MIPTMLLLGLLVGRRWAVPLGGLAWTSLLLIDGTIGLAGIPLAVLLGAANVALGVLAHKAVAWPFYHAGRSAGTPASL